MRSSKSFGFNICVADSNFLDKLSEYSSEYVWVNSIVKDSNNLADVFIISEHVVPR